MSGIPPTAAMRRRPTQMLGIGVFAMLLHLLAGTGLAMAWPAGKAGATGFVPSVCGSHAGVFAAPASPSEMPSGGSHDCCKLCAAGAAAAAPAIGIAVLPPLSGVADQAEYTTATASTPASAHSPRGPPILG